MCGFTGIVDRNGIHAEHLQGIEQASDRLTHRGPDAQGLFTNAHLAVAHRRLSIIDVADRANQPMVSPCKRYLLVYNGEVYNYRELKEDLRQRNHAFVTESDTEVVLHHLMEFGATGISALNGCFAFAFIDLATNNTLLVRDRFGINPLWYALSENGCLRFASEAKALPTLHPTDVNRDALADILTFTYNPENTSALRGMLKLPPGSYLEWPKSQKPTRWFTPYPTGVNAGQTTLRKALDTAVAQRLVADVPVGCFLSGGIDSSIVSALAVRHHAKINTFSVGFAEFSHLDETAAAETVARHIGSHHHSFHMTAEDLERHALIMLEHPDEPFADSSAIAASFLAEQTSHHVKVALSGDGADELLGGYRKHKAHALYADKSQMTRSALTALFRVLASITRGSRSSQLSKLASVGKLNPAERYFALARFTRTDDAFAVFPHTSAEGDNQKEIRRIFENYPEKRAALLSDQWMVLPNDMLTKVDLTSMRHSLEVRVPFLDPEVVKCIQSIPCAERYNWRTGKLPLHRQFNDLLPASVFERKKHGFEVPLAYILRVPLGQRLAALAHSEALLAHGFDAVGIETTVRRFNAGEAHLAPLIWTLMQVDAWLIRQSNGIQ